MKPTSPSASTRKLARLLWALPAVLGVVIVFGVLRQPGPPPKVPVAVKAPPVATDSPSKPAETVRTNSPAAAPAVLANYADFQERPIPVAYESAQVQWTLADGKDTNVIRQLAHNPLEYARMVEENPRIFRRQLVYLKATAAAVFEAAKLTGTPVRQLTLPGVDGQEVQFEIVKGDPKGSSRQGLFSGHLVGNVDSLVTLAFQDGREAFTVLSPKDNLYLAGEPREPGQVIVKAIDPNTYGLGPEEAADTVNPGPAGK